MAIIGRRTRALAVSLAVLAGVGGAFATVERAQPAEAVASYYNAGGREGTVYRLYRAYFLREPDQNGFMHWYISTYQGWSLDRISQFFATSSEFKTRYGSLDNAGFMDLIYRNVMGRAPDANGYNYWLGQLNSGAKNRGAVMLSFSDSGEYKGKTGAGIPPGFRAGTNARSLLDTLKVSNDTFRDGYDRDLFKHWDDEDRNGCNTRGEVRRERLADGRWWSIWDGLYANSEGELQIDHVVALSEAWYSGANTWDNARRDAFADWQVNLTAVSGGVNQAKDNKDARTWTPPRAQSACAFAEITVTTKAVWGLNVDPGEKSALARMLTGCTAGSSAPPTTTAPPTTAPPTTAPPTGCSSAASYTAANGGCVANYEDGSGDVDCGQLPSYMKPVAVHGSDYYGLDGDSDGVGCEG